MMLHRIFIFAIMLTLYSGCSKGKPAIIEKIPASLLLASESKDFKAGFGKAIITPDLGLSDPFIDRYTKKKIPNQFKYTMAGYGRGRYAKGVHDHLWARAVVFESGGVKIGIVYLDLIGMHFNHILEIQNFVCKKLSLDYLIIGCTHNHEGPDTIGIWGKFLKSGIRRDYLDLIKYRVFDATKAAVVDLEECDVHSVQFSTKSLGLAIDIRKPVFIPDLATLLQFTNKKNEMMGQIIHWEVHPESLSRHNDLLTSDFPHFVRKNLEEKFGGLAIYWSGAVGGLIAPVREIAEGDLSIKDGTFEHAELMGKKLVALAVENLPKKEAIQLLPFRVVRERSWVRTTNWRFIWGSRIGIMRRKMPKRGYFETEIVAFKLGDLSLQTIPGEIYPELVYGPIVSPEHADFPSAPLETPVIFDLMQGKVKLVLGLALDEIGYIVPLSGWDEKKPFLGPEKYDSYGEELSPGVNFAKNLHTIVERIQNIANNSKQ